MPQCNFYTYLAQCSWLLIIYVSYYVTIKQYLLPSLLEKVYLKLALTLPSTTPTSTVSSNISSFNNSGYTF